MIIITYISQNWCARHVWNYRLCWTGSVLPCESGLVRGRRDKAAERMCKRPTGTAFSAHTPYNGFCFFINNISVPLLRLESYASLSIISHNQNNPEPLVCFFLMRLCRGWSTMVKKDQFCWGWTAASCAAGQETKFSTSLWSLDAKPPKGITVVTFFTSEVQPKMIKTGKNKKQRKW